MPGARAEHQRGGLRPASQPSPCAERTAEGRPSTTVSATADEAMRACRNHAGSASPARSPAAAARRSMRRSCGTADKSTCSAVRRMATASEPSTNALGTRRRRRSCRRMWRPSAARNPRARRSCARHEHRPEPCAPAVTAAGTSATTIQDAQALRSDDATMVAKRSPRIDISAAPPGTLAKMPVVLSRTRGGARTAHAADVAQRNRRTRRRWRAATRSRAHERHHRRREVKGRGSADDPRRWRDGERRLEVDARHRAAARPSEERPEHPRDRRVQRRACGSPRQLRREEASPTHRSATRCRAERAAG